MIGMAMPTALIVFFSQSGSTARVAEAIARGLESAGYECDLRRIGDGTEVDPGGYDIVGVGSPVHYYRIPFIVSDYVKHWPDIQDVPAFSFLLHGTYRFDAANDLRRSLAGKGGREVGHFHCYGESHYLGHLREGYLFSPDRPSAEELECAERFGGRLAEHVAAGTSDLTSDEPPPPMLYRLERFLLSRWLIETVYSRLFRVDPARCTACGVCVKSCPTANVQADGVGQPTWGRSCIFCMGCEMNCPEDAISSFISRPETRWLVRLFLKYHVRHWTRDKNIRYVPVVQRRGEIKRVKG